METTWRTAAGAADLPSGIAGAHEIQRADTRNLLVVDSATAALR